MATTTPKNLYMVYNTSLGDTFSQTFPEPLADITKETIETAAAGVIACGVFTPDGGTLTGLKEAYVRTVIEEPFVEPAV